MDKPSISTSLFVRPPAPLAPLELAPAQEGYLACRECKLEFPAGEFAPLSLQPCPFCGAPNFIPGFVGAYRVYETLADGGMSRVYRGAHPDRPEIECAVKLLPPGREGDPVLIKSLLDEIATMEAIGAHPCLVRLIESGTHEGSPFMVTGLVLGESLSDRVARVGPLSEVETLMIALRLLTAETHVYHRGYLFRDLKPGNVLLHHTHGAMLCDFGICMKLDEALNYKGDMIQGSPLYFPPERLLGEGEQAYSEIYSLGLVLYFALTGRPYYNATEIEAVAQLHVWSTDTEDQERKLSALSPDLAEVLMHMIQRQGRERYQTYLEVERDLFQILCNRLYSQGV